MGGERGRGGEGRGKGGRSTRSLRLLAHHSTLCVRPHVAHDVSRPSPTRLTSTSFLPIPFPPIPSPLPQALAEGLLTYFVETGDKEAFSATLYSCYTLIRADVALELAWRNKLTDYVMPFILQYMRDTNARIAVLEARTKPAEEPSAGAGADAGADAGAHGYPYMQGGGMLAIANEAYNPVPVPLMGGMAAMGVPGAGFGGAPPMMGGMGLAPPPPQMGGMPQMGGYGGY